MLIDRYLVREVAVPMAAVSVALVAVFATYSSSDYLAEAVEGLIPVDIVLYLIALKTTIALEVLLPTALYFSVVIGFGRLYSDYEMTALSASGVSDGRIVKAALRLALVVALAVACVSLLLRPWAYQTSYRLEAQAEASFDISKLQAGRFYETKRGGRIIFVEHIDREAERMDGVFVQRERLGATQVLYAQHAHQAKSADGQPLWTLRDGYAYELDRTGTDDRTGRFDELILNLAEEASPNVGAKRKAASTGELARSADPKDTAEFQWRLSMPFATLLLAVLGVVLSRAAPRQGRYGRAVAAVLVYAVYYNLSALAKSLVEQGQVGPVPGLWWINGLLALGLWAVLWQRVRPGPEATEVRGVPGAG